MIGRCDVFPCFLLARIAVQWLEQGGPEGKCLHLIRAEQ